MKRILAITAAAFIAAAPFAAHAEEHAADKAAASSETTAAAPAAAEAVAPVEHTLKDGTKIVVEGDAVSVVAADGTKSASPDGEWELEDGSKITTADGKLVPGTPAAAEAPAADAAADAAPAEEHKEEKAAH